MLCSLVLIVDGDNDDEWFFLFGLVTVKSGSPPVGGEDMTKVELERGKLTWNCFKVISFSGVPPLAVTVAVTAHDNRI